MNELKVRAWIEGQFQYFNLSEESSDNGFFGDCVTGVYPIDLCIGIKDKNGVDIYKSDRLRYRLFHTNQKVETIVIWNDDFATFGTEEDKLFDWLRYHNLIEVIGNIHQT